jgi:hypothetical protein
MSTDAHTASVVNALSEQFPLMGIALRHHRTTRGNPLSFADKPYLVELYCDSHKIEGFDCIKAVQVGWSELMVQLCLERAGWAGRVAAYVLPSYQLRDRFVKRRINPVLERVPAYMEKVPDLDPGSLKIKRFGKGSLLFLGSNTVNDFIEFSADVLIVDEFDRCVQENLALARDRLRASPHPQLFRIGNPTRPRVGVAALYDHSDGRRWHVLSQDLRPLVHEWSEAQGSGTKLEAFYRSVLGKPYQPKGTAVDREMLAGCAIGKPMDMAGGPRYAERKVVAGVDVGRLLHISIATVEEDEEHETHTRKGVWCGTVQTFDQVWDILIRYGPVWSTQGRK